MKFCPSLTDISSKEDAVYQAFSERVDLFVAKQLANYRPAENRQSKAIHDCVWGTVVFHPWELQIIDSPLLQRLRRIKQLAIAVLTYPSANHSRLEHTLGVTAVIGNMINSINQSEETLKIPDEHIRKLRLAALLHDVGHCFFSHQSEKVYGQLPEFRELKAAFAIFKNAQPHEVLGYMIINCPSFRRFFLTHIDYPCAERNEEAVGTLLAGIGRMIVGALPEPGIDSAGRTVRSCYLTEMINGQFDADSMDYLCRDAYATGLPLTYNTDRFLYKIRIAERKERERGKTVVNRHLTIPVSGITTVEEMAYSKLMLSRYVYQHQKVVASESLWKDLVHGLQEAGKLQHPADFLEYTDEDISALYNNGRDEDFVLPLSKAKLGADTARTVSDVAGELLNRALPKRALVLNANTVKSIGDKTDITVVDIAEAVSAIPDLRSRVFAEAREIRQHLTDEKPAIELYDIFVEIPKTNTSKNYTDVCVLTDDGQFVRMTDVVKLREWTDTFSENAWNAFVFSSSVFQPEVSLAAIHVLEREGIVFDRKRILNMLKGADKVRAVATAIGERF